MKRQRVSTVFVDYQKRCREFAIGDLVFPLHARVEDAGRVTAVWPAVGMLDINFPMGTSRYPVEDIVKQDAERTWMSLPRTDTVPGGAGTVSVPGGPYPARKQATEARSHLVDRVARAFVKKALYWHNPDRKYRATRLEQNGANYLCPRCSEGVALKPAIYKREEGQSVRLLGCPSCMFLIRVTDINGHPDGCA